MRTSFCKTVLFKVLKRLPLHNKTKQRGKTTYPSRSPPLHTPPQRQMNGAQSRRRRCPFRSFARTLLAKFDF
ncbi:Histone transcription regulator slm9 [Frankliniella fusca]|uniref:Histone transcription regulator slm9 n=1 Tax=Frankliniella fusca TaxID=407009 RepID=A0AAE1H0S4_9NEOP|nr:Histone transcription regulator slm9 [Frankliniella fusca]